MNAIFDENSEFLKYLKQNNPNETPLLIIGKILKQREYLPDISIFVVYAINFVN